MDAIKYLTLKEMAQILNRCDKTFRKYVKQYGIPHILLGRDMLFNPEEVTEFLRRRTTNTNNYSVTHSQSKANSVSKRTIKLADDTKNRYADLLGLS